MLGVECCGEGDALRVVVHRSAADDVYRLDGAGRVIVDRAPSKAKPLAPRP